MRKIFLIGFCFWSAVAQAQSISGKITGADSKPLEKASVVLLQAKDSSVQMITAADKSGVFRFERPGTGMYLIKATNVGYTPAYSDTIRLEDKDLTIAAVTLEKGTTQLAGVVVSAKRPMIEAKPGKMVLNVESMPSNTGLNALELLEKSPGVTVDNDGNVSLKGKPGVLILIDGKQTYMSGQTLANFLKSIQSNGIDQIEILTSPPAKYDAAGNAGIINIKTKKGVVKGGNGTVNLGYNQGILPNFFGDVNFNYRGEKVNLFGGYNGGSWQNTSEQFIDRNFYKNGALSGSSDQLAHRHGYGNYHSAKLGMDYYFSKKDVAGVVVNGNFYNWNQNQDLLSNLRNTSGAVESILKSQSDNGGNGNNITTNVNYKHSFDSSGREWTVDLDQAYYKSTGNNKLITQPQNAEGHNNGDATTLLGSAPSNIRIYSAKTDYVHPFKRELKLEAGLKSSFSSTDNAANYLRNAGTGWVADNTISNHFIYKENINAAYTTLTKKIKKWELSAGIRMESTIAKGHELRSDSSFKRNYTNFFPSAGASFNLNDNNQLSLNYNRRITRPDFESLNPAIFFLDSLTYGQGNPYLMPQFTNNIEMSHTFKRMLTTTINYTKTSDIITQILKQHTEEKRTYQTVENLSSMQQWGISVMFNKQLTKWWSLNAFANATSNHYKGIYNSGTANESIAIDYIGFNSNMTNSFTFLKTWGMELSGWYVGKDGDGGLVIFKNMGALNAMLSKQLFNKRATIKAGVRDIFKTQVFDAVSRYSDVDIYIRNSRDSRRFSVSFTYKFGKNNIAPVRNRRSGSSDEQNRVKSGGGN
ncbi:TonB-dependent receptor domain-containing protein [Niabella drilacis]|uniref:Outer membrane receptor proteins, mostly Fe transport n=1 Tax=Niabella drilacis (strain DSM 25811 / CCM 8410 / CCUG 62505 / LMG 26954 / E90) TaxID=1285928 RepID=A0A1G6Q3E0_NIADE|nr:TonB-dependent receptor [Niabella drilacis]SDC86808.1 Outer membrane receptor proteins, mostly Fe transport [Niabella drilacis]